MSQSGPLPPSSVQLSCVAIFLFNHLIRQRDKTAPVPLVAPGAMCLRVRCRDDEVPKALDALRRAGALDIRQETSR